MVCPPRTRSMSPESERPSVLNGVERQSDGSGKDADGRGGINDERRIYSDDDDCSMPELDDLCRARVKRGRRGQGGANAVGDGGQKTARTGAGRHDGAAKRSHTGVVGMLEDTQVSLTILTMNAVLCTSTLIAGCA